jgi:serine/arginine repetitive matrix protein 2
MSRHLTRHFQFYRVLSEGRLLDEERQAWQALAVNSFGNKRSRSLSRTRTKSLTRRGRSSMKRKEHGKGADEPDEQGGEDERHQSSFEYLAAQACLGNQTASATFTLSSPNPDATKSGGMHSHSNSHSTTARTLATKSSKSQSTKIHSRNNSAGNSGVQAKRIAVSKLCGNLGLDVDLDHVERENLVSNAASALEGAYIRTAPDLEGALKRHGTKVIRLADPAHIPVDKGLPVSQPVSPNPLLTQHQRNTPSPDLSVSNISTISHSKVGIAIGTPPGEVEGAAPAIIPAGPSAVSASYVPSHPYAQGGLSFSVQTSSGRNRPIDSRVPALEAHSPAVSSSKVPPLSEILARHKVSPHPYALTLGNTSQDQSIQPSSRLGINVNRDSYLDTNGLIGQFRSGDRKPDPSRMWAQLSPDIVREILPGDLQYSPYDSDLKGFETLEGAGISSRKDERMKSIHDTAGVAEALLSTAYGRVGNMEHEKHKDEHRMVGRMDSSEKLQPNQANFLVASNDLRKPSHTSSAHTFASSHLDAGTKSPSLRLESFDGLETASNAPTSGSPSPPFRPLGSPNDLDSYQDLFYQPSTSDVQHSPASPDGTINPVSWDAAVRNRRTGSSLTSLARQLGEEYEALASVNASRASSMHLHSRSRSLGALPHHSTTSGLSTTEGNLQFVLEEVAAAEFPHMMPRVHDTLHVFGSANLPEDVHSLQASSIADGNGEDDDPTGWYYCLSLLSTLLSPYQM